ncbi:MFS transporter, PPP family, 3-phenylpropionic acid transporter [Tistlia consotensis]|uniref:MFS transporter, PPP family, 3-phenylpropionic acid transporter n=1 Tax=Tistlia consotensis USBA 355 TaxID=560819 RepID=A0A1Y6CX15_9PROT|nr:MFS transporter [Tistlia consotensis]SMF82675.1 MFS transporter, PPP family, 3-phenylpropionic acid transporter [Tistlia consotensis USBA 355]SNS29799.1 MFS transporter, PPP family, 3-phenylpropionic acid transporter [Tistlia consotensis]
MLRLPPSARAALPYALAYAGLFGAIGLYLPYFPVFLKGRGFSAEEIALVVALPAWLRLATTPALAGLADSSGRPRRVMVILALGALACFLGLSLVHSLLLVALLQGLGALLHQPQMPINESLTIQASKRPAGEGGFDYGRARLWGSVAFVLANLGGGWLLTGRPAELVLWAFIAVLAATALVLLALPAGPGPAARPARRWRLPWALLAERRFLLFCATGALLQGTHGFYYAFGSLNWLSAGLSESWVGWLWATGVIAEVLLFWQGGRLVRRFGAYRMMALGIAAGLVRWPLMAVVADPWLLLPVNALHALTFAASHLGAMRHIAETVAPERAATSQALYATITGSLGIGSVMFASGWLYQGFGGHGYLAMALLSAVAALPLALLARSRSA